MKRKEKKEKTRKRWRKNCVQSMNVKEEQCGRCQTKELQAHTCAGIKEKQKLKTSVWIFRFVCESFSTTKKIRKTYRYLRAACEVVGEGVRCGDGKKCVN